MDDAYGFFGTLKSKNDITEQLLVYLTATLNQTVECASFIQEYCGTGFALRGFQKAFHDSSSRKVNEFTRKFKELQQARIEGTAVQGTLITYKVLDTVTDIRRDQILDKLRPIIMDTAGRPSCLLGTRGEILSILIAVLTTFTEQPRASLGVIVNTGRAQDASLRSRIFTRDLTSLGSEEDELSETDTPGSDPTTSFLAYFRQSRFLMLYDVSLCMAVREYTLIILRLIWQVCMRYAI